jgi:hypothetical protein
MKKDYQIGLINGDEAGQENMPERFGFIHCVGAATKVVN